MKKNKRICQLILIIRESIPKLVTVSEVSRMRQYIRSLYNMKKIDAAMYENLQVLCDEQEGYINGYG
jgi:hypothetical protein